jgi:flagellin-like hook-associated protein FlgL
MPVIKTSAATINTQRQVSGSDAHTSQALQRVPAAPAINNAKEDAARLAISTRAAAQADAGAGAANGLAPIEDADAAKATIELIRSRMSQQPETALRAQANAPPDQVLALLRD